MTATTATRTIAPILAPVFARPHVTLTMTAKTTAKTTPWTTCTRSSSLLRVIVAIPCPAGFPVSGTTVLLRVRPSAAHRGSKPVRPPDRWAAPHQVLLTGLEPALAPF